MEIFLKKKNLIITLAFLLVILAVATFYHFGLKWKWFALPSASASVTCPAGVNCDYHPPIQLPLSLCIGIPGNSASDQSGLSDSINVNDRWTRSDSDPQLELFKKFQQENKTLTMELSWLTLAPLCGKTDLDHTRDINTDQMANCATQTATIIQADYDQGFNAVSLDEFLGNYMPNFYSSIADGIIAAKQANPGKLALVFGTPLIPNNSPAIEAMRKLINSADYYMPQFYQGDNTLFNEANFNTRISNLKTNFPTLGNRIIINFIAADQERENFDKNPQIDFYKYLDREFHWAKEKINNNQAGGIGIYHCDATSPETNQWLAKLFSYYLKYDQNAHYTTGRSTPPNTTLNFIQNSGFETTDSTWVLVPGSSGEIAYKTITEVPLWQFVRKWGPIYGPRIPEGTMWAGSGDNTTIQTDGHVLDLKRGASANTVSQAAHNLVPGKNYKLEIFSKKMSGDYSEANIKTEILDATTDQPIDYRYTKNTYYPVSRWYRYPDANRTLDQCTNSLLTTDPNYPCTNQKNLWAKEEIIFTAPAGAVKVSINDTQAQIGEESVVDFAELQEYSYSPLIFIKTVDKTRALSGDTLTYHLIATSIADNSDLNFSDAIPVGTTYVASSANQSGSFDGTKIVWNIRQLLAGQTLDLSFQVTVN